jgi:peptide/nickel transport system substrate-binding protein
MGGLMTNDLSSITRPYDLYPWTTPDYYAVFFNQSKSIPLQDPAVREALSAAVDRNALVTDVLGDDGSPEYGPIPEGAPYFVSTMSTTSLDVASSTLTADGWLFTTNSSTNSSTPSAQPTRAKNIENTSVPLVVNLTVPNIPFLTKTADDLVNDWEPLGVTVNVATDTAEDIANTTIMNRDYESLLFGNVLGPSSNLYAFWDSSQRFYPGLNLAIYSNPNVDNLVESAEQDLNDASRTAEFAAAEQDIANDTPAIFLYSPDYLYVTDDAVRGITPSFIPDPSDIFRNVSSWYLNTARVLK